MEPKSKGLK